jgi:hypothetical protein
MNDRTVVQIVAGTPPSDPETAEQFYKWLDDVKTPGIFEAVRGVKKAMNCRLIPESTNFPKTDAEYPTHITVFEYYSAQEYADFLETLKSKEPEPEWGAEVGFKKIWAVAYTVEKVWEREDGVK